MILPSGSSAAVERFINLLSCPLNRLKLIARHVSTAPPRNMTKTFKVAKVSELKDGQMKEVEIPGADGKVLLSKVKGRFYATGARCTHYGAPLKNGVLTENGRLVCPWHGACFRVQTGDIEEAPAWDALPCFKTSVDGNDVSVEIDNLDDLKNSRRQQTGAGHGASEPSPHVVIVGGGASGCGVADKLRSLGFKGKVTILSNEPYPPIDRTKLSKALITDASKILIRSGDMLKDLDIDLREAEVTKVDTQAKSVTTKNGETVQYDKLVLSTGGSPKMLPLPGFKELNGIYQLRTVPQAKAIADAVRGGKKNVVVIGTGFIGMEIAICLSKEHDITMIGMEIVPLERVLGAKIGGVLQKMHESKGIKFHMNAAVQSAEPTSGRSDHVGAVKLKDGTIIPADVVIMAVGIGPATRFLKESDFRLEKDGGVSVDKHMQVKGVKDVYATGDIAVYPYVQQDNKPIRIEHWDVAINTGRAVANHIMKGDSSEGMTSTAFFWSAQGSQLRYCGTTAIDGFDEVVVQGNTDPKDPKFSAFYVKDNKVVAVAAIGTDPTVSLSSELLYEGRFPPVDALRSGMDVRQMALLGGAV